MRWSEVNEGFEYRLIIIEGMNAKFKVTDSIVIGNNEKNMKSVLSQLRMKFWAHIAREYDEDVLICVNPVRIVNGRESTSATLNIGSYKKEKQNEIIDFVRDITLEKSALPK